MIKSLKETFKFQNINKLIQQTPTEITNKENKKCIHNLKQGIRDVEQMKYSQYLVVVVVQIKINIFIVIYL